MELRGCINFLYNSCGPDDFPTSETEVLDYLITVLSKDEIRSPGDMADIDELEFSDELVSCLRKFIDNKGQLHASIGKLFVVYFVETVEDMEFAK